MGSHIFFFQKCVPLLAVICWFYVTLKMDNKVCHSVVELKSSVVAVGLPAELLGQTGGSYQAS